MPIGLGLPTSVWGSCADEADETEAACLKFMKQTIVNINAYAGALGTWHHARTVTGIMLGVELSTPHAGTRARGLRARGGPSACH
jgi:hypothetical protein